KLANVYGVDTDYLLSEDKDVKKVSQNSFSNEKKAMLEAYDKLSPKMQKKILAMINAFVEEK
ncbi:hypothetical protein, partial [Vallitalea sp.]|uniref:hypothetical protein n=1 Tax=Vallitalea sp. TaxID=1882829 RepID=UPI0025D9423E